MLLIILLTLSTTLADSYPDLIIQPAHVGLVPTLSVSPSDLPLAVTQPDGSVLVPRLRAEYIAAQVSALYRLPALSQKSLDIAVESERKACDIRVADIKATESTFMDKLKTGLIWGLGGALVGGSIAGLAVAYVYR